MLRTTVVAAALFAAGSAQAAFTTVDFSSQFNHGFLSGFQGGNTFPTGPQTYLGVPFSIAPSSDVTGAPSNNIWHAVAAGGDNPRTLSISGLNIANAVSAYTLMGTWWGNYGGPNQTTYASIAFTFSDLSQTVFHLLGGRDIRDYNFNPLYTTTLGPNAVEVFNNSGPIGTPAGQHYDRQTFAFGANAGKTLTGITLSDTGADDFQRVFLSAATIETRDATTVIPLPAAAWLLLSGLGLLVRLGRHRTAA